MKSVGMVVEGLGDRKAFPSLVAKTAMLFGEQVFVRHVVEGGGWDVLSLKGELERNCLLAAAEEGIDEIIVAIDLEDHCAKVAYEEAQDRLASAAAATGLPVKLCFCVREYETWFLEGLPEIVERSPEIDWRTRELSPHQRSTRAAKEVFERCLGQSYRPSIDQEKFTKRLDLQELLRRSRAYRKFAKAVVDIPYNEFPH